ncbi:hypothetical protein HY492_00640, partial [Candidatus Woesearchaeota archaeon]|nr:hypothetical protein [Candidatus Woesearchaeota archaeon]
KLVQGDINALSEKEEEIIRAAKEFERDKKRLAKEEDHIIDRIKELEHVAHQHGKVEAQFKTREDALKQYEDTLAKKEQLIQKTLKKAEDIKKQADAMKAKAAKVKEVKVDLKRLEALRNELEWTLEKDSRRVVGMTGKIHVKEERLSQLRKTQVVRMPKPEKMPIPHRLTPAQPRKQSMEAPEHVEETEEHFYEPPARTPNHTEPGIAAARPAEIPHLLNQAHDALASHELNTAKVIVSKLQHIHASLRDGEAKRTLGYEILDLKTSLKLAAIS